MSRAKTITALLLVLFAVLWRAYEGPSTRATNAPTPQHSSEAPTRPGTTDVDRSGQASEAESSDRVVGPPLRKISRVVVGFTDTWLLHGPSEAREAGFARWATPDLAAGLMLTDVRNLPQKGTGRVGEPLLVEATTSYAVVEQALSDNTTLTIRVAHVGGGRWRVVSVEPGEPTVGEVA